LKRTFSPEFLNRIDDVIIFNSLDKANIHSIIDIALKDVTKRLLDLGYELKLTEAAKDFVAERGYDPQFGARPLHRAIQKYIEDPLAEEILKASAKKGDTFEFDFVKDADELTVVHKAAKKKAQAESDKG
jgi:ATP-dependent Clp protease ATP-binding subunit ClpC